MRGILSMLVALGAILGAYWWSNFLPGGEQSIVTPAQPEEQRAAIERLVDEFYTALREERFEDAAAMYAEGELDALGSDPARALKVLTGISGIPDEVWPDAIEIQGTQAKAEIITSKKETRFDHYVWKDSEGKILGQWVRTMGFMKVGTQWKISSGAPQTVEGMDEALGGALEMLKKMREEQ